MARRRRRGLPAIALAAALCVAAPARAQPVVVVAAEPGAAPRQQSLVDALGAELAELGVEVVLSTGAAPSALAVAPASLDVGREVLAFVLIEWTSEALVVHFYEPAGASLRERRIPVSGTDAASVEEVAIVVRSAASALLERAHPARVSAAPPPPPPPRPVEPPREASRPLALALGYVGDLYALDLPWQHGLRAALAWQGVESRWRVGIEGAWTPPLRAATSEVTVALRRHPVALFVGYRLPLGGPHLGLQPEGALAVDPIRRTTERVPASLAATAATTRVTWSAATRLRMAWEPAARWALFVAGGAEFVLNRVEHVTAEAPVVEPLRARPRFELGISRDLP